MSVEPQVRILLTGKNGQIGWELQRTLSTLGEVVALDYPQIDLTKPGQISEVVRAIKPQLIVNAAAYTAVDQAEDEPELAAAINGVAPGILAEEARRLNAAIVHYSTDYVFDGAKVSPYTEDDQPNPLNVYGRTKLAGERAVQDAGATHLIIRTSWVYGIRGKNFLLTILKLARERQELNIVDDQIGAPTWSRLIAGATAQILAQTKLRLTGESGVYNLCAGGQTSWYGFARAILENYCTVNPDADYFPVENIKPVRSQEYPAKAIRPANSRMDCARAYSRFNIILPDWLAGLKMVLEDAARQ
jgi:dTDP-4-dehydrorhamnose reductase